MNNKSKRIIENILLIADIKINGSRPWDIQVHNPLLFDALLSDGSLALGESYMKKWWDVESLDQFFYHLLSARLDKKVKYNFKLWLQILRQKIFNLQSQKRAFQVAEQHYNIGNNLYKAMLDDRMVYTCAYWRNANNLNEAQEAKLKLSCEKLHLKPGMRILDIGCGWGSFAKYAAENYDVEVVGITVSEEQVTLGKKLCHGLNVDIRLQDYRDINEKFDRIVSLGMFEHVGKKNYDTYMAVVNRCLKDQGLFLLHTIGNAETRSGSDPWINKYIFPNGKIPSMVEIAKAIDGKFTVEDWHNFSADYDKALMAWYKNFIVSWNGLKADYNKTFERMWEYYLLSCAGSFRARNVQLWQIIVSKGIVTGGVKSFR